MKGTVTFMDMGSKSQASGRVQRKPAVYCTVLLVRG